MLIPLYCALATFIVVLITEFLHARRSKALGRIAFGPKGAPNAWVSFVPWLRAFALAAIAWSLTNLYLDGSRSITQLEGLPQEQSEDEVERRVLFVLDISPSMDIVDAGPEGNMSRADWARDLAMSIMSRIPDTNTRYSVLAFYTEALFVVLDAWDTNVVHNVFDDLPLAFAFKDGKTKLGDGIAKAFEAAENWAPKSTTIFLMTDGDTVDFSRLPKRPSSIEKLVVLGIGNATKGAMINDHLSQQSVSVLRRIAVETGGVYQNLNERHLGTRDLQRLVSGMGDDAGASQVDLRELALYLLVIASLLLVLLPFALDRWGSDWKVRFGDDA